MSKASKENNNGDTPRSEYRVTNGDDENKNSASEDTATVIERADELLEQEEHARTREYLKAKLLDYPTSVEMVRVEFAWLTWLRDMSDTVRASCGAWLVRAIVSLTK